jgi:hypothetical protein
MGTVHGVYLKYVGLSALSYAGLSLLYTQPTVAAGRMTSEDDGGGSRALAKLLPALVLGYSTVLNGAIAVLFKLEWGMGIIGKDKNTGQIPTWSYIVFFPFHIPTILYTRIHTRISRAKMPDPKTGKLRYQNVPVATEVQKGWWVGGCQADELGPKEWGGIIDLTVEFPESCRKSTKHYLSAHTWDGVRLAPADLESAATFAVQAREHGDVLVHCAHGRGRSTTVMCACLVKIGLFSNWEEAFDKGIKPYRPVCKLNRRMQDNLAAWQAEYVDGKKAM